MYVCMYRGVYILYIIYNVLFMSQVLSEVNMIFMDGTFKAAPRLFAQLYTVHGVYKGFVVPLLYCLLSDKRRETYHAVFDVMKQHLATNNRVLQPDTIMSDFESGTC